MPTTSIKMLNLRLTSSVMLYYIAGSVNEVTANLLCHVGFLFYVLMRSLFVSTIPLLLHKMDTDKYCLMCSYLDQHACHQIGGHLNMLRRCFVSISVKLASVIFYSIYNLVILRLADCYPRAIIVDLQKNILCID